MKQPETKALACGSARNQAKRLVRQRGKNQTESRQRRRYLIEGNSVGDPCERWGGVQQHELARVVYSQGISSGNEARTRDEKDDPMEDLAQTRSGLEIRDPHHLTCVPATLDHGDECSTFTDGAISLSAAREGDRPFPTDSDGRIRWQ